MNKLWYKTYDESDGTWVVDTLLESGLVDQKQADELRAEVIDAKTKVEKCHCEYCGREVLSVFDRFSNNKWWGYLGNQSIRPGCYGYSPVIRALRILYGHPEGTWSNSPLYNVHARVHSKPGRDYSVIARPGSLKILCNECFRKTYRRVKVFQRPGERLWSPSVSHVEVSVLPERGETVQSVLKDLNYDFTKLTWEE